MARRKARDPELTLFPFLSVLAAVMGTLILIIAGMSQIALANPKQRVDVDAFDPGKKSPVYVECRAEGVTIYPDDPTSAEAPIVVPQHQITQPESAWQALRMRLEHDGTRYLLLLVRADGVATFTIARGSLVASAIDVGYEPLFGDGAVRFAPRRP